MLLRHTGSPWFVMHRAQVGIQDVRCAGIDSHTGRKSTFLDPHLIAKTLVASSCKINR